MELRRLPACFESPDDSTTSTELTCDKVFSYSQRKIRENHITSKTAWRESVTVHCQVFYNAAHASFPTKNQTSKVSTRFRILIFCKPVFFFTVSLEALVTQEQAQKQAQEHEFLFHREKGLVTRTSEASTIGY